MNFDKVLQHQIIYYIDDLAYKTILFQYFSIH